MVKPAELPIDNVFMVDNTTHILHPQNENKIDSIKFHTHITSWK